MRPEITLKGLRDLRRPLLWWSLGIVLLVAMMMAVYPSLADNAGLNKAIENYPKALKSFFSVTGELDFQSPAGFLGGELFSFTVPTIMLVAAIGAGARALAGEEENGTLDLLLSTPVSRTRLVVEKALVMVAELAALAGVLFLALVVGAAIADVDIGAGELFAACLSVLALALLYGGLALLGGAFTGRRSLAIAFSASLAVAGYLLNGLGPLVSDLSEIRKASPFYQYVAGDPLRNGIPLDHVLLLVAGFVLACACAVVAFRRRDLA